MSVFWNVVFALFVSLGLFLSWIGFVNYAARMGSDDEKRRKLCESAVVVYMFGNFVAVAALLLRVVAG